MSCVCGGIQAEMNFTPGKPSDIDAALELNATQSRQTPDIVSDSSIHTHVVTEPSEPPSLNDPLSGLAWFGELSWSPRIKNGLQTDAKMVKN